MFARILLCVLFVAAPGYGAVVDVVVARNGERDALDVEIGVARESDGAMQWLQEKRIPAGRNRTTFRDLPAGVYTIVVHGREPLQRVGAKAVVGAEDRRAVEVRLKPGMLRGRIRHGDAPLPGARVELTNKDWRWKARLIADEEGLVASRIWQRGEYDLAVRAEVLKTPFVFYRTLAGDDVRLDVDVPARRVRGRVIDAAGRGVAGAVVTLSTAAADLNSAIRTLTDGDGAFEFGGVKSGRQRLRVSASGFLHPDPPTFELGEGDRERVVEIALAAGVSRRVRVVQHDGSSTAGTLVMAVSDAEVRSTAIAGAGGETTLDVPRDAAVTLFALPKGGSLVATRLPRDAEGLAVTVHVPPPSSSLRIAARLADGGAPPQMSLLMRYNGELVPLEVARELKSRLGLTLQTDAEGNLLLDRIPAGTYEFWPYTTEREADALTASASLTAAPIAVNVVSGENRATVKFQRRW